jgi:hypothetical protein
MKARRFFLPLLFTAVFALTPSGAQTAAPEIKGILNWERMTFDVTIMLNLQKAGIKLPAGRVQAEALLEDETAFFIESYIMDVQADSSTTLKDLVDRRELSVESFAKNTRHTPSALSTDLSSMTERMPVNLTGIAAEMIRHSRPRAVYPPLIPIPVRDYTGIIIIADESLPVHGHYTQAMVVPCLFPKIWDSEMELFYGRDMIDPRFGKEAALVRYIGRESIMRTSPSAMDDDLIARVGENPLRIMARGIFGAVPTDPIIDREDALLVLSSENNRQLLREGRIAIVLDKKQLTRNIP